jgi:Family of unknown function (DUF6152)
MPRAPSCIRRPRSLAMKSINAGIFFAMSCAVGQTATGHHSQAAFDQSKEILLVGKLTRFALNNPHTYLTLEIPGAGEVLVSQDVEVGPISTVQPLGLTRDSLHLGERVVVRAHPSRRGPGHTAYGLDVTRADGKVFPLSVSSASVRPPSTARATSIAGVWHPTFAGYASLYSAIGSWPLTIEGRRRLEDARRENRTTQSDCVPAGAPMLMVYPVVTTVEAHPTEVWFDIDWMGSRRVVHLDVDHPRNLEPSLQGHSIGRWKDGALVVDTVAFTEHPEGIGFAMPSSERKHLAERFTLSEDGRHLIYEVTIEDPAYLTQPVSHTARWEYSPDLEPSRVDCDLTIARRYLGE